ncbi:MAG: Ldh family oxidoreductase [Candidatus Poribacteria bacterium]|nr:Ldh family oxidoreductase [Candidatus Poribacteria bacterium]
MAETERRFDADKLRRLVTRVFGACGMSDEDAALLADTLVHADLGGTHSHGVMRVPDYVKKLTVDGVDPRGTPRIVKEFGGCVVVDGGNSMGQVGTQFAMNEAMRRAETHGIAAAAIRGSNHSGAMSYYVEQAARRDMIGIATTNALPTMAPWGGAERILGINPLGMGVPAAEESPIIYDAAFSGSSHGKVRIHRQKGLPIPLGWAFDKDGNPTTDAALAVDGLLAPIGEFKGVGLAMLMGILSSMLSGAAYGTELGDMERGPTAGADGHFVAAIKVEAFEEVGRFKERVDKAIRQVRECRRAEGVDRLYVPGEREALSRRAYARDGVPLNDVTVAELRETVSALGVEADFID